MGGEGAAQDHRAPGSARAVAAVIAFGCVGLLMMGIQPVVLGALQAAGRLSVPAMGQAAAAETLALGLVSAGLAARVRHRRLRAWSGLGVCLLAAANIAGLFAHGAGFVASRALAGVASGVIVWVAVGLITRRTDASRVNAIFLGAQALSQGAVAGLAPVALAPGLGANSGLWVMGALALVSAGLIAFFPDAVPEARGEERVRFPLGVASLSGLCSSALMMAGIVGLWVYVEPIGARIHVPAGVVGLTIAGSLIAQVLGAGVAVALDGRVDPVIALTSAAVGFLAAAAAYLWIPGQAVFIATTLAFGVLWTLALAFGLPLLIAADPTRQAPLYGPASVLLGASLGPMLAGAAASDADIRPAVAVSAGLFVLAIGAVLLSGLTRPPRA